MAKFATTAYLDAPLDLLATCVEMYLCNAQPTDRASAIAAALAPAMVMASTDFTKAAGAATGRQTTVGAKNFTLTVAGTPTHIALSTGATMYLVDTVAGVASLVGDVIAVGAWALQNPLPV